MSDTRQIFMSILQDKKSIRVLTTLEQERLINYLNAKPYAINLGIFLCLSTGLRIGELYALKWDDISLSEGELHVRRTMQRLQNLDRTQVAKTYIDIGEPKSKCSVRIIPLPDSILSLLKTACVKGAYLLTGQKSYFIEPRTMENRFKKVLKESLPLCSSQYEVEARKHEQTFGIIRSQIIDGYC